MCCTYGTEENLRQSRNELDVIAAAAAATEAAVCTAEAAHRTLTA